MMRLIGTALERGREIALFCGTFVVLWVLAAIFHQNATHPSFAPHFIVQAQAWLHGHLDLPSTLQHDVIFVNGRRLIVYPPGPTLLMMPFVAVLGGAFSDIWFTWLAGALNVALVYHLLRALSERGWSQRDWRANGVLAVTFGLGTIALWLALGGVVWFTAQTLAVTVVLLTLIGTARERWWLVSLGLGGAFLTRSPDILAGLFPLVVLARAYGVKVSWREPWRATIARWPSWRTWAQLAGPLAACFIVWAVRNKLSFGSWLDSGYGIQIKQNYPQIQYGLLSWHYVWPNFVVDFLNMPAFTFSGPFDLSPKLDLLRGGNGTSVFFTTPLFLLFFLRDRADEQTRWLRVTLWATVALLVGFSLLWNGTGWYQVGARYLFDAYPLAFMLLALRSDRMGARWLALAGAGAVINVMLANTFWCNQGACLGARTSLHHLAYDAALAGTVVLYVAIWWWLNQSAPAERPDQTTDKRPTIESPPKELVGSGS